MSSTDCQNDVGVWAGRTGWRTRQLSAVCNAAVVGSDLPAPFELRCLPPQRGAWAFTEGSDSTAIADSCLGLFQNGEGLGILSVLPGCIGRGRSFSPSSSNCTCSLQLSFARQPEFFCVVQVDGGFIRATRPVFLRQVFP